MKNEQDDRSNKKRTAVHGDQFTFLQEEQVKRRTIYMEGIQTVRRLLKVDDGKLSQVLEYDSGRRIEIPINKDGSIRWLPDKMKNQ